MKGAERETILRKLIERCVVGKQSAFTLRGKTVYLSTFVQPLERTRKVIQKIASQESPGAVTPPHLRCSTPEPDTQEVIEYNYFLRQFAKDIEAYKLHPNIIGKSTNGVQL